MEKVRRFVRFVKNEWVGIFFVLVVMIPMTISFLRPQCLGFDTPSNYGNVAQFFPGPQDATGYWEKVEIREKIECYPHEEPRQFIKRAFNIADNLKAQGYQDVKIVGEAEGWVYLTYTGWEKKSDKEEGK